MNNDFFDELRVRYPDFYYSGFHVIKNENSWNISYDFYISGLSEFHPSWTILFKDFVSEESYDSVVEKMVFSLGMVELVSYWKLTCSPNIHVALPMSDQQINWWKKLYKKGLGEFFYRNGIVPPSDFVNIISKQNIINQSQENDKKKSLDDDKVLIPIGGGKDSIVTLETLSRDMDRYAYIINPRKATINTVDISGLEKNHIICVNRNLDENLLKLNQKGFLNGHTPFSAIVAFSSVLMAYLNKIRYVALSNESSANESTVKGVDVNHQYSKSFEFEKDFIDYERMYIGSGVQYFSFLRPLTEIGIAKIFSNFKSYHYIFRSCNVGSKSDIWCGKCPKCLFVYIILSPFIEKSELIKIFGNDMLDDVELLPTFEKLLGLLPEKPFECVGRYDEVHAAVQELINQYGLNNVKLPYLLDYYNGLNIMEKYDIRSICSSFDDNNMIPKKFTEFIVSTFKKYIM